MDDIAAATGIGRTTLFRYFASKGDLIWYEQDDFRNRFATALRTSDSANHPIDAVFAAYETVLVSEPERVALIKSRMSIVATAPASSTESLQRYDLWAMLIAQFIADRGGYEAQDLRAQVPARAIWGAIFSALMAWSLSDEPSPERMIERARTLLHNL
jgi:AcrR family transcriptional regulator